MTKKRKNLAPQVDDFLNSWYQMSQYKEQLARILKPGLNAIRSFYYPRGGASVILDSFDLYDVPNKPRTIAYTVQLHINGNISTTTFTIPLSAILAGESAIIKFFEDERAAQEEKAKEAGHQRDLRDKEERKKIFDKLKLEFEPKEDAIIKYGEE